MPYTNDSYHLVIGGTVVNSDQSWSTGMRIAPDSFSTSANRVSFLASIKTLVDTWINVIRHDWTTLTTYSSLKLYSYSGFPGTAIEVLEATVTPISGTGNSPMPSEVALVHSLRSATPSRAARGRMYTPYTDNNNMEVNGNVSEARTTALCTATASLITSINALSPANPAAGEVAVLSATHNARHDVVQVIVDSKLDSQRRRERSLRPLYVEHHAV